MTGGPHDRGLYREVFDDIPVGFFVVTVQDHKQIVLDCNLEFARIFAVDSVPDITHTDLVGSFLEPNEARRLEAKLISTAAAGLVVVGETIKIRTARGHHKILELSARPTVRDGFLLGYTGAIQDITQQVELREIMSALRADIGAVLHTFRHTLQHLTLGIQVVGDVLAETPHTPLPVHPPEQLALDIRGDLHGLATSTTALIEALRQSATPIARRDITLARLAELVALMNDCERRVDRHHWREVWRAGAVELINTCSTISPGVVAKSLLRPVTASARRIATKMALTTLGTLREAVASVNVPVMSLRELVTAGDRAEELRELCPIEACVSEAIASIVGFAEERGVSIQFDDRSSTLVRVARHQVTRALSNLLHNAIKYSWKREHGHTWISVRVISTDRATVIVAIENWGVPIPADEIASGLVFRLGFRGRLSSDRGRMGTGVGLSDSLAVARAHSGALHIESRPASTKSKTDTDYTLPFVTTARFELPVELPDKER